MASRCRPRDSRRRRPHQAAPVEPTGGLVQLRVERGQDLGLGRELARRAVGILVEVLLQGVVETGKEDVGFECRSALADHPPNMSGLPLRLPKRTSASRPRSYPLLAHAMPRISRHILNGLSCRSAALVLPCRGYAPRSLYSALPYQAGDSTTNSEPHLPLASHSKLQRATRKASPIHRHRAMRPGRQMCKRSNEIGCLLGRLDVIFVGSVRFDISMRPSDRNRRTSRGRAIQCLMISRPLGLDEDHLQATQRLLRACCRRSSAWESALVFVRAIVEHRDGDWLRWPTRASSFSGSADKPVHRQTCRHARMS